MNAKNPRPTSMSYSLSTVFGGEGWGEGARVRANKDENRKSLMGLSPLAPSLFPPKRVERGNLSLGLLVLLAMMVGPAWPQELDVAAEAKAAAQETDLKDTLGDMGASTRAEQTSLAVTVYNNDLALVRDTRTVKLVPGEQDLKFMDVAERIKPETVSLRSLSDPGKLNILEQNYEFDLISPEKLMEKYIGKDVRLINKSTEVGFTEIEAKLLSTNGGPVYEIDNDIYLGHPGNVVLPRMPENLISKPTLVWKLDNQGTDHEVEVAYQTNGISWAADYVLTYLETEARLDLEGWVTLNNQSGTSYENALLKVVAGEVNIEQQPQMAFDSMAKMERAMAAAPMMQEEAFAEYHLYTLPRKTTIRQNQSKQVSLLNAEGVSAKKIYEFRGQDYFYISMQPEYPVQHPQTFITFENKEDNKLGVPLPGGIMRVYQPDQSGALQFAGEDRIEHTAKDEKVRLLLGEAFDIVAERRQTDFDVIVTDRTWEAAFEIKVRNHKDIPVSVDVIEPLGGDWEIRESSADPETLDAHSVKFTLEVPVDGETVLTYRYRVTR